MPLIAGRLAGCTALLDHVVPVRAAATAATVRAAAAAARINSALLLFHRPTPALI